MWKQFTYNKDKHNRDQSAGFLCKKVIGRFPFNKNSGLRFRTFNVPNGTILWLRLHRPDPSHRAFGYCSCKQHTKERYMGRQLCQLERDNRVRRAEMIKPVEVDHLQSSSRIFRSDQTEMVRFMLCINRNFRNFVCWMESAHFFYLM